jgi:hypothetical protein
MRHEREVGGDAERADEEAEDGRVARGVQEVVPTLKQLVRPRALEAGRFGGGVVRIDLDAELRR